jgi:hypothetical protein
MSALQGAFTLKRIGTAIVIAAGIYALAVGAGSVLYATGNMPTGATHNDCSGYRKEIAEEQRIPEEDVPQSEIKSRTEACLATHELTEEEAFRTEYLFWSIWPGIICAAVFLIWPVWTRVLLNQEAHGDSEEVGGRHHASNHA